MAHSVCLCFIFITSFVFGSAKNPKFSPGSSARAGQLQYSITNDLKEPYFFHNILMDVSDNNDTIIRYMERASDGYAHDFPNYTAIYYPQLGYYINSINGVFETSELYWEILAYSVDGTVHEDGVSIYVPKNGDHVTWNFTYIHPPNGKPNLFD